MAKELKYLIIHCTATKDGVNISPGQVLKWHTDPKPFGKGWKQVGYSKLILLSGEIHSFVDEDEDNLVDPWEITNGAEGLNSISRHICYVGGLDDKGKPKDTRNFNQIMAMLKYCVDIVEKYPDVKIAGHNQFANKACPSFDVPKWLWKTGFNDENIYK